MALHNNAVNRILGFGHFSIHRFAAALLVFLSASIFGYFVLSFGSVVVGSCAFGFRELNDQDRARMAAFRSRDRMNFLLAALPSQAQRHGRKALAEKQE